MAIRIGYEECDWQVEFLVCGAGKSSQCGCQVGFLKDAAMWGWPKSGMRAMWLVREDFACSV